MLFAMQIALGNTQYDDQTHWYVYKIKKIEWVWLWKEEDTILETLKIILNASGSKYGQIQSEKQFYHKCVYRLKKKPVGKGICVKVPLCLRNQRFASKNAKLDQAL